MKGYAYEGGIPYEVELPEPSAAFMKFLDSIPCSCGGEAHDECKPVCEECGGTGEVETGVPDDTECQNCQGTGFADEDEFIPELKKKEL